MLLLHSWISSIGTSTYRTRILRSFVLALLRCDISSLWFFSFFDFFSFVFPHKSWSKTAKLRHLSHCICFIWFCLFFNPIVCWNRTTRFKFAHRWLLISSKYLRTTPTTQVSLWKLPLLSPIYPKDANYLPTTPTGGSREIVDNLG